MNKFFLLISLVFIGCQDMNSNSSDRALYGGGSGEPHLQVLKARCMNCHTYHSDWLSFTTDDDWINSAMVIRGDSQNSMLIQRIINSGYPSSNMPQGGSPLSASEYQALLDWIDNMP